MELPASVVDIGRIARSMEVVADRVGAGALRATERKAMVRVVGMGATALADLRAQLEVAHVGDTAELIGNAAASLSGARDAVAGAAQVRRGIPLLRSAQFDAASAEAPLRDAIAALQQARPGIQAIPEAQLRAARDVVSGSELSVAHHAVDATASMEQFRHVDAGPVQRVVRKVMVDWGVRPFNVHAVGQQHIPESGPFILAPVHGSMLDPFHVMTNVERPVRFMAKAELWKVPGLRTAVTRVGAFPVDRTDAAAGEAMARELLGAGQPVMIFPEGTTIRLDTLAEARNGVARLALETGVPVIPVGSYGNKPSYTRGIARNLMRRVNVVEVYGAPIHVDGMAMTPANQALVRERIWRAVDHLHQEARSMHASLEQAAHAAPARAGV